MDTLFWYTGAAVYAGIALRATLAALTLLHMVVRAAFDVWTQLLVLYVEKKPRAPNVSVWDAWRTSLDIARWDVIMYRIRRCIQGKANVRHPLD